MATLAYEPAKIPLRFRAASDHCPQCDARVRGLADESTCPQCDHQTPVVAVELNGRLDDETTNGPKFLIAVVKSRISVSITMILAFAIALTVLVDVFFPQFEQLLSVIWHVSLIGIIALLLVRRFSNRLVIVTPTHVTIDGVVRRPLAPGMSAKAPRFETSPQFELLADWRQSTPDPTLLRVNVRADREGVRRAAGVVQRWIDAASATEKREDGVNSKALRAGSSIGRAADF